MKKETQASKFEGVLDLRRHPIDPEHYGTVAKATAEALANEIAYRFASPRIGNGRVEHEPIVRQVAAAVLLDWFTGKFMPGGPTDPPAEAPT